MGTAVKSSGCGSEQAQSCAIVGDTSVGLQGQVIQRVRHDRELQRSLEKIMLFKGIPCVYAVQKNTGILKDGKRRFSMKLSVTCWSVS